MHLYTVMSKNKTKQVNVRLTDKQFRELSQYAENNGDVPLSQVIRIALSEYVAKFRDEKDSSDRPRS